MQTKPRRYHTNSKRRPTKGWTAGRRAAYAARIRQHRPWTRSTGPRTAAGRARSCQNALKHGMRGAAARRLYALLGQQRRFVIAVGRAIRRHKTSQNPVSLTKINFSMLKNAYPDCLVDN